MRGELRFIAAAQNHGVPSFGTCLGAQQLAVVWGGGVGPSPVSEIGFLKPNGEPHSVSLTYDGVLDPLFEGIDFRLDVLQWHNDAFTLGSIATLLATSESVPNQAFMVGNHVRGVQFHPELTAAALEAWLEREDSMSDQQKVNIRAHFEKVEETYSRIGRRIIKNFIDLAQT
jgi:GMP synthase-like glutamine amidotransferase